MNDNTDTGYTAGPICIDELVTVLGQYPAHYWNGWLCPDLDPHAVEQVMAAFAADPHSSPEDVPTHEWDGDVLVVTEWDGPSAFRQRLDPDADGLYALGAYSWVWSPDTEGGAL